MSLPEKADKLEEYVELSGDEMGEYWSHLCSLARYSYCMHEGFEEQLESEIDSQLKYLK